MHEIGLQVGGVARVCVCVCVCVAAASGFTDLMLHVLASFFLLVVGPKGNLCWKASLNTEIKGGSSIANGSHTGGLGRGNMKEWKKKTMKINNPLKGKGIALLRPTPSRSANQRCANR